MFGRTVAACTLFSCVLCAGVANAQPGDRQLDMKARVLDVLFPLAAPGAPYVVKMVLRFGDSNTQITVLQYPGGKCEILRYSVAGTTSAELSQLISRTVAENAEARPEDIAGRLAVHVDRSPIGEKALSQIIDQLRRIRISPVLANRVALGNGSEYEFWYDTYQESVRYTIVGPFHSSRQDELVAWMITFRASIPSLVKSGLPPNR